MTTEITAGQKKVTIHHWDESAALSESALRHKLEGLGYHCNRYDYPAGTVFDYHSHGCDKIDAVLSGCFRITVSGKSVDLRPGDYIVIPEGVMHRAEVVGGQTVVSLDGVRMR